MLPATCYLFPLSHFFSFWTCTCFSSTLTNPHTAIVHKLRTTSPTWRTNQASKAGPTPRRYHKPSLVRLQAIRHTDTSRIGWALPPDHFQERCYPVAGAHSPGRPHIESLPGHGRQREAEGQEGPRGSWGRRRRRKYLSKGITKPMHRHAASLT